MINPLANIARNQARGDRSLYLENTPISVKAHVENYMERHHNSHIIFCTHTSAK